MAVKQTPSPENNQEVGFTGEVISMKVFADRCEEIILSDSTHKRGALEAQITTLQRMMLPKEYTAHFADIHNKVDFAIAHNKIQEAEELRSQVDEILHNDPVALEARDKAIGMLSSSIDAKYIPKFYETLDGREIIQQLPPFHKVLAIGYKVLRLVMSANSSRRNNQNTK
jgi:hypothetical protein